MTARPGRLVALVVALALAGACSAPVDSGPKTIRSASLPEGLRAESSSTTTTAPPTGESDEVTVYFIGPENRLVPVKRRVSRPVTVEKILQTLFAGPTTAERIEGLRTAISAETAVLGAPIEARIVTVDLSDDFALGPLPEQIAAYAQVVFTAFGVGEVRGVVFAQNGRRQEVPQGDGSLTSTPLGPAAFPELTPR